MARAPVITDEQILAAAHEVFLARGIRGTTAEVARKAGVAEGSLFNRFRSKEALFRAAMAWKLGLPAWLEDLGARVGQSDVRRSLERIGQETLDFFERLLPVVMMMLSNPGRGGRHLLPFRDDAEPAPLMAVRRLSAYFEAEMRLGRLRRQDPEIVARSFLGSLWHYVFFETMARSTRALPMARETFVRGLVQVLWEGLSPDGQSMSERSIKKTPATSPRGRGGKRRS